MSAVTWWGSRRVDRAGTVRVVTTVVVTGDVATKVMTVDAPRFLAAPLTLEHEAPVTLTSEAAS